MKTSGGHPECASLSDEHLVAAQQLIGEICADYPRLLGEKAEVDRIISGWRELMVSFRAMERAEMVEGEASADQWQKHHSIMSLMLLCASGVLRLAEQHLAENYHLEREERTSLAEQIQLILRHEKILQFEMKHWHGPKPSVQEMEAAERSLHVDPASAV